MCRRYTTNEALIKDLWLELEKAYTSKKRHYHNLTHIGYMLELADRYKPEAPNFDLLLFAVFYHDAVYSTTSSDNEAKSAVLAVTRLSRLGIQVPEQEVVQEMIVATKAHEQSSHHLTNLLIDLDLAILGADEARYDRYSQGVRKEYNMYPDLLYKPGRCKVLRHFLQQPHIYKTPVFQAEFEDKARANLLRELAVIEQ